MTFIDALRKSGVTVVTCQNCAPHQLGLDLNAFSIQMTEPDRVATFDVALLLRLIAARPEPARPRIIAPGTHEYLWLVWWLSKKSQPNVQHLDHIPLDRMDDPGVVVWVYSSEFGPEPVPYSLLVDGTHRALRKVMTGQPFSVIDALATERDHDQVLTFRDGIDRELWPDAPRGRSQPKSSDAGFENNPFGLP